jgi:hypothetical protein
MEPESSLLYLQDPDFGPYPVPGESDSHINILSLESNFKIILQSAPRSLLLTSPDQS